MRERLLTAGLSLASRHACAALATSTGIAVCEQERATRVRGAGPDASGLPDQALDLLVDRMGCTRDDIGRYTTADPGIDRIKGRPVDRIDHHLAHASTAYRCSPHFAATILVCDQEDPKVSLWLGQGDTITRIKWPWRGAGFSDLYSACSEAIGFATTAGGEQRFEALARLRPDHTDDEISRLFHADSQSLHEEPGWQARVDSFANDARLRGGVVGCAPLAAALQNRIGELLVDFLGQIRQQTGDRPLCLGGDLFYNSSFNSLVKRSGLFPKVFVPPDPGNPGLAVGTALHAIRAQPRLLSPFLGPAYDSTEIKATLDNCKLRYDWPGEDAVIDLAVQALLKGRLVAWFEGAMEWGPRALGARSILASPFSPYVLENLNGFLKRRAPWRGYALSATVRSVPELFDGPDEAPYMECDYRPRDGTRFRHVLPDCHSNGAVRVHSVDRRSPFRFARLLEAFGAATGVSCLVNTSFNGFHEPIVCSPRDAVRVFYGSGLDMLVLDRFVLTK
jgi:carbamoyltransferase